MVLSYYKFLLKSFFGQSILKFRLRRKNYIGKRCTISKDCILEGGNVINDGVYIFEKVKLKKNARVGHNAVLTNIEVGENSILEWGVLCSGFGDGKITIGKNTYIGINNVLDRSSDLTIGDFVHIAGPSTGVWTHSSAKMVLNNIDFSDMNAKERVRLRVNIENNVYIGGNCTIYPGVTIHHHSIVAPNSVVANDVESYTMVGGVTAKFIKKIEHSEN
jgi:acetyltransferase-like isoleucine patch superfamily enzyme